jgi:hypothetical protein
VDRDYHFMSVNIRTKLLSLKKIILINFKIVIIAKFLKKDLRQFLTMVRLMKKKRCLVLFLVIPLVYISVFAQEPTGTGKPVAEIFTDFHYFPGDTVRTSGFAINRAHLGYNYNAGNNLTALIMVNIGLPEELAEGSVQRRYAYFREASVAYTREKLTLNFGMVSTRIFNSQQGFWGKRYLAPEYQYLYAYGSVADIGMVIDYRINKILKVDLSLINGKGYSNIQFDNSLKTAFGLTISKSDKMILRLYGDMMKPNGVMQTVLIAFAGYKNDRFSIGAEESYKTNADMIKGHNTWGFSATGAIFLSDKSEIFMRYDNSASATVAGETLPCFYNRDQIYFITGLQYTFNKNLRIALNYRGTNPEDPARHYQNAWFVNAHFKF